MTEETFKIKMAFLQNMYCQIEDGIYKTYWEILKKYSDDQFSLMVNNIVKTFIPTSTVKFPLIPHFLKTIGLDGDNLSQLAVTAVKKAIQRTGGWFTVSFGDKALHATIERFGGWPEICEWTEKDWSFNEKRFIQCYEAERASFMDSGSDKLPGMFEIQNSQNEYMFNEEQKKFADKSNETRKIEWEGFEYIPELPKDEEKKKITDENYEAF